MTQAKLLPVSGAAAGKVLGTDGTSLQWQTGSVGTITGVTADSGLTGGGASGTVGLAVDTASIQARVAGNCAAGSFIAQVNSNGTVVCQADTGGTGNITGNVTMVNSTASVGNILKNGSRFIHNFGGDNTFVGVESGSLPPMLLNEFQKQQRRINALELELQEIKLALRARSTQ